MNGLVDRHSELFFLFSVEVAYILTTVLYIDVE
jgi:hypothetical protein